MNILLLNWRDPKNPKSGGAEYVTHEHAKGWVRLGDKVTWFAAWYPGAPREEWLDGVHIIRRGSAGSVFFYAAVHYIFHKRDFDIIVDEVHGVPYFAALYARAPVILFLHEVAGSIWDVMYSSWISRIGSLLEHLFIFVYKKGPIWTDAQSTVQELVDRGVSHDVCHAIPCPTANAPVAMQKPKKNKWFTCIFVGRLVRMKRIEDLLTAFADIYRAEPKATFLIVGDGDPSYVALLKQMAKTLGIADAVNWYGRVTEKKKYSLLARSHLLLHASVKEGWGLVVLEAGSQWTPSVVYKVNGLVDVVKDGKTGSIVPSCDPHDLANATLSLYADANAYSKMQKAAYVWSNNFHWDDVISESHALLTSVYEQK